MTAFGILGAAVWWPKERQQLADAELLPTRVRARSSPLTRMLAHVAGDALRQSGLPPSEVPMIVGSAFGEMDTTCQLLPMCFDSENEFSPARFQRSVHNAGIGQLSIVTGNRRFSSAIAAGFNTVPMAFIEAQAWMLGHGGPLLVLFGDEALPDSLRQNLQYGALAAAFVLGNEEPAPLGSIEAVRRRVRPAAGTLSNPEPWSGNPCASAAHLHRLILDHREAELVLNPNHQEVAWWLTYRPKA